MNKQTFSLLDSGFYTVGITYGGDAGKAYTFKVPDSIQLEVGDLVVIPNKDDKTYGIQTVAEIHEEPQIDPDFQGTYRWIIQKIDFTQYRANLEREAAFEEHRRNVIRQQQRAEFVKTLPAEITNFFAPQIEQEKGS